MSKNNKPTNKDGKFVFKASHFREILKKQEYRCYVTNRELTPEVTFAEHIVPLRLGGTHSQDNICLVHEILYRMKRYHSIDEIVEMSVDVIKNMGTQYGYKITKANKR
jgi:hypothetical protein